MLSDARITHAATEKPYRADRRETVQKIWFRHVLENLELKLFFVGQPWWPTCFMLHLPRNLGPHLRKVSIFKVRDWFHPHTNWTMRDLEACPIKFFLKKTSDEKLKTIVMYYFTKKSNVRTFEFWPKCYIDSLREPEETIERSNNFVRPTEIFEISSFFA